jgi:hypothetical protein
MRTQYLHLLFSYFPILKLHEGKGLEINTGWNINVNSVFIATAVVLVKLPNHLYCICTPNYSGNPNLSRIKRVTRLLSYRPSANILCVFSSYWITIAMWNRLYISVSTE